MYLFPELNLPTSTYQSRSPSPDLSPNPSSAPSPNPSPDPTSKPTPNPSTELSPKPSTNLNHDPSSEPSLIFFVWGKYQQRNNLTDLFPELIYFWFCLTNYPNPVAFSLFYTSTLPHFSNENQQRCFPTILPKHHVIMTLVLYHITPKPSPSPIFFLLIGYQFWFSRCFCTRFCCKQPFFGNPIASKERCCHLSLWSTDVLLLATLWHSIVSLLPQ